MTQLASDGLGLKEISSQTTDVAIQTALADEGGNLQRAARRLGVTDRALQMRRALQRQDVNTPGDGNDGDALKTREVKSTSTNRLNGH